MVAAFDDLERDHISDNAHEVVEGTEDLVDHIMAGSVVHWCRWCGVVHCCDVAHWCYHDRGSDLVESSVVRSSMHLMRVHNGRSMVDHRGSMVDHWGSVVDHWGRVMDHWGSVVDHRGDMVDHRGSVNESGHSRLWLRRPQVDNFSRVSSFDDGFLNSSFNSNFFDGFFHNRFDNSLFDSLLYSSSWDDRLSYNMDTDRQLPAEDGRVVVRGVHRVVDQRCVVHHGGVVDHGGVHSMVDHRGSVVDDGWAVVDGVMDKGSRVDRGVMDSVNGSMCVVDWHVRPVHAVCCLQQRNKFEF